ncbi:otu domain-containing protein at3g57810 [Phtheirospermum japonicum]|uniref:Ubiquitin thioesterase OTU n=1 Tax=Phtheirospermum japonicum TaxID=374723 RepID=A0A830CQF7_9LAMI|nr:otu domain-containing protein at3g57810 [Phtheirospermum japonicum]
MTFCSPISTSSKNVVCLIRNAQTHKIIRASNASQHSSCHYSTFSKHPRSHYPLNGFQAFQKNCSRSVTAKHSPSFHSLTFNPGQYRSTRVNVSSTGLLRLFVPKQSWASEMKCNVGPFYLKQRSLSSAGVFIGSLVCFSTSQPSYAEAREGNEKKKGYCDASSGEYSPNKKILTDYSVIGIPGDGRCLFRSVAHGACVRSGKPAPNENLQRELADEFIEGDFETYVSKMRRPHVWGVYMHDEDSGGLISIAEYGQEYSKDNPIQVLYHGYGHYDALCVPAKGGARSRL